jgi:hypothetical protein
MQQKKLAQTYRKTQTPNYLLVTGCLRPLGDFLGRESHQKILPSF